MTMDANLISPQRLARSFFFSQAPIGIGTEMTESLESFTCRLAREHGVSRHSIEQIVNRRGGQLYVDRSGPPRLDSPTDVAAEFGRRLAALTMRPDVIGLGLGRLTGRISTMHTLRKSRAWCTDCFCDNRAVGVPAHLPLIWSLVDYRRCSKHGQELETHCPCCGKNSVASNSWSRAIDHCPSCDKDLARRRGGELPSSGLTALLYSVETDLFCSRVLGQFAAQIGEVRSQPDSCAITAAVDSAIARGLVANRANFSALAGLSNATLHTLISGRGNPSLTVLMRIAAAADVSMAGMLYPALWRVNVRGHAPSKLRQAPRLRVPRKHNWEQIRSNVYEALAGGGHVSLRKLSNDLQLDESYFSARIGPVRDEISKRARQSRVVDRNRRVEELTELAKRARDGLLATGSRVSARAIGEVMNLSVGSPIMRRALKLARM